MDNYTDINSKSIDKWVESGWEWSIPIDHETFLNAQNGVWDVVLTPCKPVPHEWFPAFEGAKLLGLASGGGQQMPVFAALGADCTVLDYSDRQLESERMIAEREGYAINIVKADMTKRLPFADCAFDMIFHPVSNCYIEDVRHVWNECYRVLKPGGVLLAGMDNGINFLFSEWNGEDETKPLIINTKLPFNPLRNPEHYAIHASDPEEAIFQFSHTFEEQVGGQLKAGLVITDLYEDYDNAGALRHYIPTYVATRAVKPS